MDTSLGLSVGVSVDLDFQTLKKSESIKLLHYYLFLSVNKVSLLLSRALTLLVVIILDTIVL